MSVLASPATLADTIVRPQGRAATWLRDGLLVLAGSLLIAASAQVSFQLPSAVGATYANLVGHIGIKLPTTPVPVTGQTFAVLLTGLVLGSRRGALAMLAYLGYGLAGLGVFALGASAWTPSAVPGVPVILGPTAGYLFGCVLAAWLVGWLAERGWDRRVWNTLAAMLAGSVAIYAVGLAWLSHYVGAQHVLLLGLYPFLVGDTLKILAAAALLPGAWQLVRATRWGV
jgi:biotin transport system substrate-specific component